MVCVAGREYGYVSLALVKYNMKEVPGSTLVMLVVHVYPMPHFSEAVDQETSSVVV